jgi:hypothetical protein
LIKLQVEGSSRESGGQYQADAYSQITVGWGLTDSPTPTIGGGKDPIVDPKIETALITTVLALSVAAFAIPSSLPLSVALIAYATTLLEYLRYPIVLLGSRKKKMQLNVVFNSINKRPVAKVRVSVYDSNDRLREVQYTNKSGTFSFLVPPGKYRIEATKDGYSFPSKRAVGLRDTKYENVYYGRLLEVKEEANRPSMSRLPIDISIPMDPVKPSALLQFYAVTAFAMMRFFRLVRLPLMIIGTILTISILRERPDVINTLLFIVYVILWFLEAKIYFTPKIYGTVRDDHNQPVSYAIIRAFDSKGRIKGTMVSGEGGEFIFTLQPGVYYFDATKTGYKSHPSTKIAFDKPKDSGKVNLKIDKITH